MGKSPVQLQNIKGKEQPRCSLLKVLGNFKLRSLQASQDLVTWSSRLYSHFKGVHKREKVYKPSSRGRKISESE